MKQLASVILAVLFLFATACNSTTHTTMTPKPNAEIKTTQPAPTVAQKEYTEADFIRGNAEHEIFLREEEKKLTSADVRRNWEIKKAVLDVAIADYEGKNKNLPEWVAKQYASFENEEYTKEHAAYQRSFGWGTGIYQGKQFYWFAHTNTDAWLQINISTKLDENIRIEAVLHKDGYGHPWEVDMDPTENNYAMGAPTWMGIQNDWPDSVCTKPRGDACDIGGALDKTVADVNAALKLQLVVRGKFPWEPLLPPLQQAAKRKE